MPHLDLSLPLVYMPYPDLSLPLVYMPHLDLFTAIGSDASASHCGALNPKSYKGKN
ncbi:MAG: hypothetical protein RBS11_02265 [Sulfurimonas sp.]|nr:hypothetical protein [Sulfurimonas sp.]